MIYTKIKFSWYFPKLPIPIKVPDIDYSWRIVYIDDYTIPCINERVFKKNLSDEEIEEFRVKSSIAYPNLKILSIEKYYYDNDGKKLIE